MGNGHTERILEILRMQLVRAMVEVACEQGFGGASIALVCERAGVSRRAFQRAFDSRESCFLAALDEGHRCASSLVSHAFARCDGWLEGVRTALAELLLFFDASPQLAHVCIVESLTAGPWALERREQHVAALTQLIVSSWESSGLEEPRPYTNAAVVMSVLGVIQSHLLAERREPLVGLLGPLMGLVGAPYLRADEVTEEVRKAGALAERLREQAHGAGAKGKPPLGLDACLESIPSALRDPRARRARGCLLYVAQHPGASNRQIATSVGVTSHTQISGLLGRLARMGLIDKQAGQPGRPNAWSATDEGRRIAASLLGEVDRRMLLEGWAPDGRGSHRGSRSDKRTSHTLTLISPVM